jgi:hypothetical protein
MPDVRNLGFHCLSLAFLGFFGRSTLAFLGFSRDATLAFLGFRARQCWLSLAF